MIQVVAQRSATELTNFPFQEVQFRTKDSSSIKLPLLTIQIIS